MPSYRFTPQRGIDTEIGEIAKPGGPRIVYEVGGPRHRPTEGLTPQDVRWMKTISLRPEYDLRLARRTDGVLVADVFLAAFTVNDIKGEEDLVESLLTITSFDPKVWKEQAASSSAPHQE